MKFSALLVVAILAVTASAAPRRHRNKSGSNYNREDHSNREDNSNHIDNSKKINQSNGGSSQPLIGLNLLGKETSSNTNNAYIG